MALEDLDMSDLEQQEESPAVNPATVKMESCLNPEHHDHSMCDALHVALRRSRTIMPQGAAASKQEMPIKKPMMRFRQKLAD